MRKELNELNKDKANLEFMLAIRVAEVVGKFQEGYPDIKIAGISIELEHIDTEDCKEVVSQVQARLKIEL